MLLAVGYHYIAEHEPEQPRAIFPVTTAQLAAQIAALAQSHQLVSRDELVAAVDGEGVLPDRACVLTFDDGLRCQYELALPVLERLGAGDLLRPGAAYCRAPRARGAQAPCAP